MRLLLPDKPRLDSISDRRCIVGGLNDRSASTHRL